MRAYVVDRYGTKDGLQLSDVSEPDVGDHDVLVEVRAAGVNPLDGKIRDGEFKLILPYRVPFVPGHDVAGVVVRVGDGADLRSRRRGLLPAPTRTASAPSPN